ncbi:MAG TPA: hypothetical protein VLA04_00940 [Verrucomicrobiae bacterium]|nr:hypothetical protein [Verrucomicrobiae bacterium]
MFVDFAAIFTIVCTYVRSLLQHPPMASEETDTWRNSLQPFTIHDVCPPPGHTLVQLLYPESCQGGLPILPPPFPIPEANWGLSLAHLQRVEEPDIDLLIASLTEPPRPEEYFRQFDAMSIPIHPN